MSTIDDDLTVYAEKSTPNGYELAGEIPPPPNLPLNDKPKGLPSDRSEGVYERYMMATYAHSVSWTQDPNSSDRWIFWRGMDD